MDIDVPLRTLGEIDIAALRDRILAQDEAAWEEQMYRQEEYEARITFIFDYVPPRVEESAIEEIQNSVEKAIHG